MMTKQLRQQYYRTLLAKDSEYKGVFYVGVKTTGVFCHPTCPARKPKFENCEFFETAEQALLASFRPCQRCKPLSHPRQTSELIQKLVKAVEEYPEKHWRERDFQQLLPVDASTARRQFKKRFGMTFVAYARARRLGILWTFLNIGTSVGLAAMGIVFRSMNHFMQGFHLVTALLTVISFMALIGTVFLWRKRICQVF